MKQFFRYGNIKDSVSAYIIITQNIYQIYNVISHNYRTILSVIKHLMIRTLT